MNFHHKYLKYKHKYLQLRKDMRKDNSNNSDDVNSNETNNNNENTTDIFGGSDENNSGINVSEKTDTENEGENQTDMTDAINNLTINLFENLESATNVISPMGMTYALSLVQLGTRAESDAEITHFLNRKYSLDDLESFNKWFNNDVLHMTTVLAFSNTESVNKEYIQMVKNLAYVVVEDSDNVTLLAQKINTKIEQRTNAMIKDLVVSKEIPLGSNMIVTNVVHFNGSFQQKFNTRNTTKMKFHKTNNDVVEMMHQIDYFNYYQNQSIQLLELFYAEKSYALGIILPKKYLEQSNLDYTINNVPTIPLNEVTEFVNNSQYTLVDLYLPRFNQKKQYDLTWILQKMSVTDIFKKSGADLDIISEGIYVSKIYHAVSIVVDETSDQREIKPKTNEKPILFKADHTFLYYVRHIPSNTFLIYGDYQG